MKEPISEELETTGLSRKRKISVLIFVIGFWIFYFWYKGSPPPPPANNPSEIQQETSGAGPIQEN